MDWFLELSRFFEQRLELTVLLLLLVAAFTLRRRGALVLAIAVLLVLVPLLKEGIAQPRPCSLEPGCPADYGLPSGHSAFAAAFAFASIGFPAFWFFAPAGAVIAYSRLYLGVHSVTQVASGVALGVVVYYFSAWAYLRLRRWGVKE